ncbi:MAG: nuclear transport factor 2 family protein [Pseudomonadota bacterium]
MRQWFFVTLLFAVFAFGPETAVSGELTDRRSSPKEADALIANADVANVDVASEVEATVRQFFGALADNDRAATESFVTSDFVLFEHGEIWSVQKLIEEIFGDGERAWTLDDIVVVANGDVAHVTYLNRGTLVRANQSVRRREYLESALLLKVEGDWRIQFLHSTRMTHKAGSAEN